MSDEAVRSGLVTEPSKSDYWKIYRSPAASIWLVEGVLVRL